MRSGLFVALAAIAVIAGCAKEVNYDTEKPTAQGKRLVTINANIVQTKTTVSDEGMYSWQNTEQIGVVENDGMEVIPFAVKDAAAGTFTGEITNDPAFAVTPISVVSDAIATGGDVLYTIKFGDITNYVPGTTNALMIGTNPTAGSENSYSFEFRHAAALVKVPVVNVPVGTAKVKLTMDKPITGTWKDLDSTSPVIGPSVAGDPYLTLTLKDAITEPNTSADFYFPVPVNTYTSFQFELLDADGTRIKGVKKSGLNITLAIADLFITPTITLEGVKKGASNTLNISSEAKFPNSGSLTENGITWTPSITAGVGNPTPGSIDQNNIRGQQFGSANNNTTKSIQFTGTGYEAWSASATSDANAIGITNINVTVGAKNDNTVTIDEVSVGGIKLAADSGNTYTAADGQPATIAFSSESVLTGDIVIKATLTTAGAFYLKSIEVNPTPSLPAPVITATSNVSTVTINWEAVNNAESYDVEIVNQDDATKSFSATGRTELTKSFENVPDGTYNVTVTAKAEGFNDGIGATTVVVKAAGPDKYGLIEEDGAFEDGGKYVFVLPDGETPTTYYVLHTHRTLEASGQTITNGIITEPADKYIWVAEAGSEAGKFAIKNLETGKYLPNATGTTTGASSSSVYISLEYLSNSGAYFINLGSRYVTYYNTTEARFYQDVNDQIEKGTSLVQKDGAFKVYKLNYSPKEAFTTPTGLSVYGMVLSWDAVSDAASYNVTIGETVVNGVNTNSYTFNGEAGYYNVSVVAVPSDTDTYKNSEAATLAEAKFGTPTIATPVLADGGVTPTSVTATWTDDTHAANGYHCEIFNGETKISEQDVAKGVQKVTFTGLTEDITYTVKVNAVAVTGDKPYAASAVATINLVPDGLHAEDVTSAGSYVISDLEVKVTMGTSQFIAGDATGLIYVYKPSHGLSAGDVITINGTASAYQNNGGILQFSSPTITVQSKGDGTANHGTATEISDSYLNTYADAPVPVYIQASGSQDGQNITVGTKVLHLYAENAATDGKMVNVNGYLYGYSSGYSNYNFVAVEITEDASIPTLVTTPTDGNTISWDDDKFGSANAETITVELNGAASGYSVNFTDTENAWTVSDDENGTITVYPNAANTSTEADKTLDVTITHKDNTSLTSTITLKQKKQSTGGSTLVYTFATAKSTSNSAYASTYDVTINSVQWNVPGNQSFDGYVRIGGKSLTNENRVIAGGSISSDVDEIRINTNGITNASLTVNSIAVTAHSSLADAKSGSNVYASFTTSDNMTFAVSTAKTVTFTKSGTADCSGKYYRIVFNLSNSKSSNYGLDVNSIEFYK